MQTRVLEELSSKLHRLRNQISAASLPENTPLDEGHELVQAARECDFMLPEHLTVRTLADKVNQKIGNVEVLLERARKHEDLPETAQVAAEQEYIATEQDVALHHEQGQHKTTPPAQR